MARRWRAWHPGGGGPGSDVRLGDEEAHHVVRVLRLRAGEPLAIFDGAGREWEGTIVEARGGSVLVRLGDERTDTVEPSLPLTLVQGLSRPDRVEWALEKATEVGVRAIVLATCARSDGPPPSPSRLGRWRRIVLEAAKQSGRRRLPELVDPSPLRDAVAPLQGLRIVLRPGAPPLAETLAGVAPEAAALAVGPEGGFEEAEVALLGEAGWKPASLGPRVLRTETAGPVAAALVLHRWGDLGSAKPD
jgi:16S rRNA (uracil1498-N3)-methyltransferase